MLELLLLLLGFNFTDTTTQNFDEGKLKNKQTVSLQNIVITNSVDTGGETQPIPPKK